MYTGEIKLVQMRFQKFLVDAVIDRFGEDVMISPDGENAFTVSTEIAISPQFYGWLAGLGEDVKLAGPDTAVKAYKDYFE